jgi:hypothetical protein
MAFALVESNTPCGLGQMFKDADGMDAHKLLQTFTDYGVPSKVMIKNNFGKVLFEWSIMWSVETTRRQAKDIIRSLLNQVETTDNYEMFVISTWEEDENGNKKHVAFDLDNSYENGRVKVYECLKRWRVVKNYNYRAPDSIKYDEIREKFEGCDEKYKEKTFFENTQEKFNDYLVQKYVNN